MWDFLTRHAESFCGIAGSLVGLVMVGHVAYRSASIPLTKISETPAPPAGMEEIVRERRASSRELRVGFSEKLFDVGLLLLGVVWGLVLADKIQIDFRRWQQSVLFTTSNVLVLASLYCHLLYKRRLAILLWDLADRESDFSSDAVEFFVESQWKLLFAALLTVLLILLLTRLFGS